MATKKNAELIEKLSEGIEKLTTSEDWMAYLEVQSRFHKYSFGNSILILTQCPEATKVASFRSWLKLDRHVQKGEKAIWIVAPIASKKKAEELTDECEDEPTMRFTWVPVFDVAQTEGAELPTPCNELAGDDPTGCFERLVLVAESIAYAVSNVEFGGTTNGQCDYSARTIKVEATNSPAQRVKTLAHEIAHALLHENFRSRSLAELEAESTAYVVCQALGIESGEYSFAYAASWAGGGEEAIAKIKASGGRIQKAASFILREMEASEESEAA